MNRIETVSVSGLEFGYKPESPVFSGTEFQIRRGQLIHLSGPSGSGQATLLKILSGQLAPQAGSVLINNDDITQMSFEEFLPYRLKIGYSFENGGLLANRTLAENILLPHLYHQTPNIDATKARVSELAKRFQFSAQLDMRPASVPGGLRKLVTIFRMILMNPDMALMDDPFSGLDRDTTRTFFSFLEEERKEGRIPLLVMTARDDYWVQKMGAEVYRVENGKVVTGAKQKESA